MHFPVSFGTLSCPRTEIPPELEIPLYWTQAYNLQLFKDFYNGFLRIFMFSLCYLPFSLRKFYVL